MAGDVALEARGLGKRYGTRLWALRDIDLEVPAGSVTALVGPNGAGKSTLIKAWVGFERPTAGRVAVAGIDPWHDRPAAVRRTGYVPQVPALYRELSIGDHLALAWTLRPGFDRAVATRRLDELGIPLERRPGELSGGQQAQVGLAIALGTRAPVLLLDEPLASLDPLARREFLAVLTDAVRADGSTAILSSHIVTDIEAAGDRIVVLGGGRKLLDAAIDEAIAAHRVTLADARPAGAAPAAPGHRTVATFAGPGGERLTLARPPDPADAIGATDRGRPASLEEIVIGYLTAGREPELAA